MEPGGIEEESIADSDNQILQPLESNTWRKELTAEVSFDTLPMKADLEIREGNFLEASSRTPKKSLSFNSVSGFGVL